MDVVGAGGGSEGEVKRKIEDIDLIEVKQRQDRHRNKKNENVGYSKYESMRKGRKMRRWSDGVEEERSETWERQMDILRDGEKHI